MSDIIISSRTPWFIQFYITVLLLHQIRDLFQGTQSLLTSLRCKGLVIASIDFISGG